MENHFEYQLLVGTRTGFSRTTRSIFSTLWDTCCSSLWSLPISLVLPVILNKLYCFYHNKLQVFFQKKTTDINWLISRGFPYRTISDSSLSALIKKGGPLSDESLTDDLEAPWMYRAGAALFHKAAPLTRPQGWQPATISSQYRSVPACECIVCVLCMLSGRLNKALALSSAGLGCSSAL